MKYPYKVYRMNVDGHEFWAAESEILKGCVAQGETDQEALEELKMNEEAWLETALEYGIEIPPIPYEKEESYSGKFTVRLSPFEHQRAAEQAKKQGISLNQYVNDAIVSYTAAAINSNHITKVVEKAAQDIKRRFLNGISYSTPTQNTTNYSPKMKIQYKQ